MILWFKNYLKIKQFNSAQIKHNKQVLIITNILEKVK